MSKEELITALKEANIIYHEPVDLASGKKSDYYVDIKEFITVPSREKVLIKYMKEIFLEKYPDATCVGGEGYGGVPLVESLGNELNLKKIFIRDKLKGHGRPKIYEGHIEESDRFVILDDVLSSGGSIKKSRDKILNEVKATFLGALAVVNRGHPQLDFPCYTLIDVEDL